MFPPSTAPENEQLTRYVEVQLDALRAAAFGLTDEQIRQAPCRSDLSVGTLLKHTTWVQQIHAGAERSPEAFFASFTLTDEDTVEHLLAEHDAAKAALLPHLRSLDLDADVEVPAAPWDGLPAMTASTRYTVLHLLEELARHAGHADIVREQLDGAQAKPLEMAVEGRPANQFAAPWTPSA